RAIVIEDVLLERDVLLPASDVDPLGVAVAHGGAGAVGIENFASADLYVAHASSVGIERDVVLVSLNAAIFDQPVDALAGKADAGRAEASVLAVVGVGDEVQAGDGDVVDRMSGSAERDESFLRAAVDDGACAGPEVANPLHL